MTIKESKYYMKFVSNFLNRNVFCIYYLDLYLRHTTDDGRLFNYIIDSISEDNTYDIQFTNIIKETINKHRTDTDLKLNMFLFLIGIAAGVRVSRLSYRLFKGLEFYPFAQDIP